MEDQFALAAELARKANWDRLAEVQSNLRANLHPAILPLLIVDAESDSRTWDFIAAIDTSARSKPFLLREFARRKTGADRGEYRAGKFWSLYGAAVQLHATETIPAMKRAVENADTHALIPLAQLAGSDVHDFLLTAEARKVYGESAFDHPVDLNTAIFLTGDLSRLDAVIDLTYGGESNVPFDAADALRAVCPAATPPGLPYDAPMAQREETCRYWTQWSAAHKTRLIWNQQARRYVLKNAGEK
jgi:hypothetical protein